MHNKFKHLSACDRQFAYKHKELGKSNRWIGKQLGVSHTTIGREFVRNTHPCPGEWQWMNCYEQAAYAERRARKRRSDSKRGRGKFSNNELRGYVITGLRDDEWSPEDISKRAKSGLSISAKAIYDFIKRERPDLTIKLCYMGVPRRARVMHRRSKLRVGAPPKKPINDRPLEVLERQVEGHYEIDTVHSQKGQSASVLTIIERKYRRCWYRHLPNRTAESVNEVLASLIQHLPIKPKTITADNGAEFSELWRMERQFNLQAYYCDPYKAWQRGSVEYANRRLRRTFPKGTDFSQVATSDLETTERLINNKPMRLLGYQSPNEAFRQYLKAA